MAMKTKLEGTLRGACLESGWSYAVLWKLRTCPSPPVLVWEDGFSSDHSEGAVPKALASGHSKPLNRQLLATALAKMSFEVHHLGEGALGSAAITGKHRWMFGPQHAAAGVSSSWSLQFSAGIQTVAVIPVSGGVLQLGSNFIIPESPKIVARFTMLISSVQESSTKTSARADLQNLWDGSSLVRSGDSTVAPLPGVAQIKLNFFNKSGSGQQQRSSPVPDKMMSLQERKQMAQQLQQGQTQQGLGVGVRKNEAHQGGSALQERLKMLQERRAQIQQQLLQKRQKNQEQQMLSEQQQLQERQEQQKQQQQRQEQEHLELLQEQQQQQQKLQRQLLQEQYQQQQQQQLQLQQLQQQQQEPSGVALQDRLRALQQRKQEIIQQQLLLQRQQQELVEQEMHQLQQQQQQQLPDAQHSRGFSGESPRSSQQHQQHSLQEGLVEDQKPEQEQAFQLQSGSALRDRLNRLKQARHQSFSDGVSIEQQQSQQQQLLQLHQGLKRKATDMTDTLPDSPPVKVPRVVPALASGTEGASLQKGTDFQGLASWAEQLAQPMDIVQHERGRRDEEVHGVREVKVGDSRFGMGDGGLLQAAASVEQQQQQQKQQEKQQENDSAPLSLECVSDLLFGGEGAKAGDGLQAMKSGEDQAALEAIFGADLTSPIFAQGMPGQGGTFDELSQALGVGFSGQLADGELKKVKEETSMEVQQQQYQAKERSNLSVQQSVSSYDEVACRSGPLSAGQLQHKKVSTLQRSSHHGLQADGGSFAPATPEPSMVLLPSGGSASLETAHGMGREEAVMGGLTSIEGRGSPLSGRISQGSFEKATTDPLAAMEEMLRKRSERLGEELGSTTGAVALDTCPRIGATLVPEAPGLSWTGQEAFEQQLAAMDNLSPAQLSSSGLAAEVEQLQMDALLRQRLQMEQATLLERQRAALMAQRNPALAALFLRRQQQQRLLQLEIAGGGTGLGGFAGQGMEGALGMGGSALQNRQQVLASLLLRRQQAASLGLNNLGDNLGGVSSAVNNSQGLALSMLSSGLSGGGTASRSQGQTAAMEMLAARRAALANGGSSQISELQQLQVVRQLAMRRQLLASTSAASSGASSAQQQLMAGADSLLASQLRVKEQAPEVHAPKLMPAVPAVSPVPAVAKLVSSKAEAGPKPAVPVIPSRCGHVGSRELARTIAASLASSTAETAGGHGEGKEGRGKEETEEEERKGGSSGVKKVALGDGKARPRDRQLIQDRLQELRELMPNATKLSIEILLERVMQRICFLRQATSQQKSLPKLGAPLPPLASVEAVPVVVTTLSPTTMAIQISWSVPHSVPLDASSWLSSLGLVVRKGRVQSKSRGRQAAPTDAAAVFFAENTALAEGGSVALHMKCQLELMQ